MMKNLYPCLLKKGQRWIRRRKIMSMLSQNIQGLRHPYQNDEMMKSYCDHLLLFLMSIKKIIVKKNFCQYCNRYGWIAPYFLWQCRQVYCGCKSGFLSPLVMDFHYTLYKIGKSEETENQIHLAPYLRTLCKNSNDFRGY